MIGKSGNSGGIVGDPYPVSLTYEDIDRLDDEFEFCERLTRCGMEHGTLAPMRDELNVWCRCGKCVPAPEAPANEELFELLHNYEAMIGEYREAVSWYADITSKIKEVVGNERCTIDADDWIVKVARNGRLTIDRKPVSVGQ
jgi:hypothetical protein